MMLTTPGGNPASFIRLVSFSAVSGVSSEGWLGAVSDGWVSVLQSRQTFKTTVFPVATAGAILSRAIT